MGRSYEIKEGRRVIVPTERQMAEAKRKQAEANQITDDRGRTGMTNTVKDIKNLEEWAKYHFPNEKQIKEIFEAGRATDDFINLNVLRILKALRDGTTKNERDDPNFKFNLESLKKKWANSEVEMMAAFDKNGMFLGYETQADKGLVQMRSGDGQIIGGTTIHSHPSEDGRFFGGNFSDGDWKGFLVAGEKTMIVTSREGTYILEREGAMKLTRKAINKSYVVSMVKTTLALQKLKDEKELTKFGCTKRDLVIWRDHHKSAEELAKSSGLKYTFVPNKGFEGLAG